MARGIALGTASHGQGTAAALLKGEAAGAMSGLAMAAAALFTAAIAPAYIPALPRLLGIASALALVLAILQAPSGAAAEEQLKKANEPEFSKPRGSCQPETVLAN